MERIKFEDGIKSSDGYVVIDEKTYIITEAEYTGNTPLSAYVMNKLQDNIENGIQDVQNSLENNIQDVQNSLENNIQDTQTNLENAINAITVHKYKTSITEAVSAGGQVTLPCYYKVGQDTLDVYLNGEKLILSSDIEGTDGHYQEVGEGISNQIKTTTDWNLESGDILDFVVRGDYSDT